jgi:hypothetical protein
LEALTDELDKFIFDTELQAKEIIEKDIGELVRTRNMVMENAKKTIDGHKETVIGIQSKLDAAATRIANSLKKPGT